MKRIKWCLVVIFALGLIDVVWSFFVVSMVVYARKMQIVETSEEQYKIAKNIIREVDEAVRTGIWFGVINILCSFVAIRAWLQATSKKSPPLN
ncbi:MAG TPA: hypothetical protein DCP71_03995 [Verrucomicrobiales bacterium]|nr:hypothetical protein [Verrucomicrobiales bacterium]